MVPDGAGEKKKKHCKGRRLESELFTHKASGSARLGATVQVVLMLDTFSTIRLKLGAAISYGEISIHYCRHVLHQTSIFMCDMHEFIFC